MIKECKPNVSCKSVIKKVHLLADELFNLDVGGRVPNLSGGTILSKIKLDRKTSDYKTAIYAGIQAFMGCC